MMNELMNNLFLWEQHFYLQSLFLRYKSHCSHIKSWKKVKNGEILMTFVSVLTALVSKPVEKFAENGNISSTNMFGVVRSTNHK